MFIKMASSKVDREYAASSFENHRNRDISKACRTWEVECGLASLRKIPIERVLELGQLVAVWPVAGF